MTGNGVLGELLAWNREHDAHTTLGLSNHCSMGLIALQRLGADDARLQRFADDYAPKLAPIRPPVHEITDDALPTAIGTGSRFPELLAFYSEKVRSATWSTVLGEHLPVLVEALGSDAYHPLIRIAYGVDIDDALEVAAGLAYLADAPRLFRHAPRVGSGHATPVEVLDGIRRHPSLGAVTLEGFSITARMAQVEPLDGFTELVDAYSPTDDPWGDLAIAALRFYEPRPTEFTPMHAMTSLHAMVMVRNWAGNEDMLARRAAQALAASYLADAAPPLAPHDHPHPDDPPSWEDIVAMALEVRGDEHAYKVTYSAQFSAARWGHDPCYRTAAAGLVAAELAAQR